MPANPDDVRAAVVAAARSCGADAVRIAPADPLTLARERLAASVARGDLATWSYDAVYAEAASDPRTLLADARSVVCIAVRYATPARPPERGRGRVSNYAWSPDYHRRLRAILNLIAARIEQLGGRAAPVCDTAPLAERAFAERAGLGWIGKHTNLIAPGLGSYVYLGEIVTSLALEPDPPLRKSCGACSRCIDACPTGALRGDYTIDATRCISDLTQRTDGIPPALRPLVGAWVWGCDLCQDACPPTRRARADAASCAPLDAEAQAPSLQALLRMRRGEFRRRFARTAAGWRGAAVLRRNAAVALGNGLDRGDVPVLTEALREDPHPQVRGHAAWALGRIGSPQAYAALHEARAGERDASVCREIAAALAACGRTLEPCPRNAR